jgi:hypothetical protein
MVLPAFLQLCSPRLIIKYVGVPGHVHLSTLSHNLRNVFRFIDGIVNQSFKKSHLYTLGNGMRYRQLD